MPVLLVHNAASGKGRARAVARAIADALQRRGQATHEFAITPGGGADLATALAGVGAAVLVGGDGTVHHALDALVAAPTPVFHAPTGTENLFSRQWRMTPEPSVVAGAVIAGRTVSCDLGVCRSASGDGGGEEGPPTSRRFAVMLSVGPDAAVIHRLARARTGPIRHHSYLRPIMAELLRPSLPPLTIDADARRLVSHRSGLLVVANTRHYALRMDPAPHADPHDGFLDIVFMPARTAIGALWWLVLARLRLHRRSRRIVVARAAHVRVARAGGGPDATLPVQMDGEAVPPAAGPLEISVEPAALAVLLPAPR